ncbi:MAG: hypothetical protein WBV22_08080 [Anaerolineaceae bacterium]
MTLTGSLVITVANHAGIPFEGLNVYVFDGMVYTGYNGKTDASGQVVFTLPEGSYRFRADYDGVPFWSGSSDHCTLPGCTEAAVTVTVPLVITVANHAGIPFEGLNVYVFDGTVYTGYNGKTDASVQVVFTLPEGSYRFRADFDGVPFWSDSENGCSLPGCTAAAVSIPGGNITETNITIDYTYDPLGRLTRIDHSDTSQTLARFAYTYNSNGNRTAVTESLHLGQPNESITTIAYTYDTLNRLTLVDYSNTDDHSYTYDAVGNTQRTGAGRLSMTAWAGGESVTKQFLKVGLAGS